MESQIAETPAASLNVPKYRNLYLTEGPIGFIRDDTILRGTPLELPLLERGPRF